MPEWCLSNFTQCSLANHGEGTNTIYCYVFWAFVFSLKVVKWLNDPMIDASKNMFILKYPEVLDDY